VLEYLTLTTPLQTFSNLQFGIRTLLTNLVSTATATLISYPEVGPFVFHFIHFFCSLISLEHKYPHAAVWTIFPGYKLEDGKRQYPTVAMVANLAKPTSERPALMTHYDAVTFFHEMGHAFHGLLSRTEFSRFHGTKSV
jgi:hypothetical protein